MLKFNDKETLLSEVIKLLQDEHNLQITIGAELEFYLKKSININLLKDEINLESLKCGINNLELEEERGENQFELRLAYHSDPLVIANQLALSKNILAKIAKQHENEVMFDAKPFNNQPGSALHIHLAIYNREKQNLLLQKADQESLHLLYIIGGMLATLKETMVFFAPDESSYARFCPKSNSPINLSWGGNNRTVAIRIPDYKISERRVEHRVAGADSDPYMVIWAILLGAYRGLSEKIMPNSRIYGDASHPQYQLEPLPKSFEESLDYFNNSKYCQIYSNFVA